MSELVLIAYTAATYTSTGAAVYHIYTGELDSLNFTTTAPGGFGKLTCRIQVKDTRLISPDLRLFANIALRGGPFTAFLGRWDEPGLVFDNESEYFDLSAMGAQSVLADDAQDFSYATQTPLQIITDQIVTQRSAYLPIDGDLSLVQTNNTLTFSPAYAGQTPADVLNQLVPLQGDYTWFVWDHKSLAHVDTAGLPTWQLSVMARDTTTTHLRADQDDFQKLDVRPAIEYFYNVITLKYKDSTSLLPGSVTVRDSRLNSNLSQGTAPFPMRRFRIDKSNLLLSATQAAAIANAYLGVYQNGGYKIDAILTSVKNASGMTIPLWQARAGMNLFTSYLTPAAPTVPLVVSSAAPNPNQFYIQTTNYTEDQTGGSATTLEITGDTFADTATFQLQRLETIQQQQTASKTTTGLIQAAGMPMTGPVAASAPSNAPAGSIWEVPIDFPATATNTPTSITLTSTTSTNVSGVAAINITQTGFVFRMTVNTATTAQYIGSYTTVGN